MLAISGPQMARYAERIGADFHVIHVEESDFPCGEKFRILPIVQGYDRTLFIDGDVLVEEDCPSLFDVVPKGFIGAHDDGRVGGEPLLNWAQAETNELTDSQGVPRIKVEKAYNSGIIVCDREHAKFWEQPQKPYPRKHCMEQWWEWVTVVRYGIPHVDLPPVYNYQWWFDRRMPTREERPDIKVRHFAGMTCMGHTAEEREALMRQHATIHPRRELPCLHLGRRIEFREGCGGRMCRHECDKGLPAVPGGLCQWCWDHSEV